MSSQAAPDTPVLEKSGMSATVGDKRVVPEEFSTPVAQKKFLVDGKRVQWHADKITAIKKSLNLEKKKWTADAQKLLDWLCEDPTRSIKNAHQVLNIPRVQSERPRKERGEAGKAAEASPPPPPPAPPLLPPPVRHVGPPPTVVL